MGTLLGLSKTLFLEAHLLSKFCLASERASAYFSFQTHASLQPAC